jgi:tRNA-splicing ligase RtcB
MLPSRLAAVVVLVFGAFVRALRLRKFSARPARYCPREARHAAATAGVECRKDEGVLDETPGAYKAIDEVMAAQDDLVEIVHALRQVLCVKG